MTISSIHRTAHELLEKIELLAEEHHERGQELMNRYEDEPRHAKPGEVLEAIGHRALASLRRCLLQNVGRKQP